MTTALKTKQLNHNSNKPVDVVEITTTDCLNAYVLAEYAGHAKAFMLNFRASDCVFILEQLHKDFKHPSPLPKNRQIFIG